MGITDPIVPEALINFRCYESGSNKITGTVDVELPDLDAMTETITGAGIAGEVETTIIGFFKAMSTKINFRQVVHKNFSLANPHGVDLTFRAALQSRVQGSGIKATLPFVVRMKCHMKKLSLGKMEPGKPMGNNQEMIVDYLKVSLDGMDKLEVDPTNFIYAVNGTNHLLPVKTILGEV